MGILIKCYPFGLYGENTYLITDEVTGHKAVIDPGYISDDIKSEIGNAENLKYILLTHGHHDHFMEAGSYIKEYPDALFAAPSDDIGLLKTCPRPDKLLNDRDSFMLGETEINVIATPGHTAGGICFKTEKEVFTGDTLFRMSVGRTDLPTGDWNTLVNSIRERLFTLSDDLTVYPGHEDPTTIGYEKKANPFV